MIAPFAPAYKRTTPEGTAHIILPTTGALCGSALGWTIPHTLTDRPCPECNTIAETVARLAAEKPPTLPTPPKFFTRPIWFTVSGIRTIAIPEHVYRNNYHPWWWTELAG